MSQIKQLIQLHQQGKSIKSIASSLAISKNTVKAYLAKVLSSEIDVQALLKLDDPILEGEFHAGNPAYKDERYEHFIGKLDYFAKELNRKGVTRMLLWEEYRQDYPQGYGYTQFSFHLAQQLIARKLSMVLQHIITPAAIADNNFSMMQKLFRNLKGYIFADIGFIAQKAFEYFYLRGLKLVTTIRKNMKNKLVPVFEKHCLKKRGIIESVNDLLMTICDIDHTRHRSAINCIAHAYAGVSAYSYLGFTEKQK